MGFLIVIAFLFGVIAYGVSMRVILRRSFSALYAGDYDRARRLYTWGTRLFPRNAHFYRGRALTYVYSDDRLAALDDICAAVKRSPRDPILRITLAHMLGQIGRIEAAMDEYDQLLAADPDQPLVYIARSGTYLNHVNDYHASLADCENALSYLSQVEERIERFGIHMGGSANVQATRDYINVARALKAVILSRRGDIDQAIAQAETIASDSADVLNDLAEVYFTAEDYPQADTLAARALTRVQADAEIGQPRVDISGRPIRDFVEASVAITRFKMGDLTRAVALWQRLMLRDDRFRSADWVADTLNWPRSMTDALREMLPHVNLTQQPMDIPAP